MIPKPLEGLKQTVFGQLYATASTGKIKTWQTWVNEEINNIATIWTMHGYLDGMLQKKPKKILKGKNLGKSNETTSYEQACKEAESTFKKKIAKRYITEIPTSENEPDFLLPMLAKPFKKSKHHIIYTCMHQPKLNGVRCLAKKVSENEIDFTSKTGKSYNDFLGHLVKELLQVMEINEIWDGEIYKHGWTFQQILRRVKKVREDTNQLEYWIYDVVSDASALNRNDKYHRALEISFTESKVYPVQTGISVDENDIHIWHTEYVKQGFEGIIIRNMDAPYKMDHRSKDLQKLKTSEDHEFKIIGGSADVDGGIIYKCEVNDNIDFSVRPKGTLAERKKMLDDIDNAIGKPFTVRHEGYTEDGKPCFPVGICVRDFE